MGSRAIAGTAARSCRGGLRTLTEIAVSGRRRCAGGGVEATPGTQRFFLLGRGERPSVLGGPHGGMRGANRRLQVTAQEAVGWLPHAAEGACHRLGHQHASDDPQQQSPQPCL